MPSRIKSSSKTKIGEWMTRLGHLKVRKLAEHAGQEPLYPNNHCLIFRVGETNETV